MHFRFVDKIKSIAGLLVLATIDMAAILTVFLLSVFVRTTVLPLLYGGFPPDPPLRSISNLLWFMLVWLFFLQYEGLYGKRFSFWDEIEALVKVSFLSTATVFVIISIGKMALEISRTLVVLMGLFAIIILPLFRIPTKRTLQKIGVLSKRVLIIGASSAGQRIAQALAAETNYGYRVVGFLDDDPEKIGTYINGCKVYDNISSAQSYIKRYKVNDIFIALPDGDRVKARNLITELQHKVEHVYTFPICRGSSQPKLTLFISSMNRFLLSKSVTTCQEGLISL
jgi:undecaprenyl-phosphate galactose phosphotransferase